MTKYKNTYREQAVYDGEFIGEETVKEWETKTVTDYKKIAKLWQDLYHNENTPFPNQLYWFEQDYDIKGNPFCVLSTNTTADGHTILFLRSIKIETIVD